MIASTSYMYDSSMIEFILQNSAATPEKEKLRVTMIPGDGIGPELMHSVKVHCTHYCTYDNALVRLRVETSQNNEQKSDRKI